MKRSGLALILLVASTGCLRSPNGAFEGTWKLNESRSRASQPTLTYTSTATGFHFSNGSNVEYDFAIDGKDYPVMPDRTVAWTKTGDNVWEVVIKDGKGTVLSRSRGVLTSNGHVIQVSNTSYRPDGTTSEGHVRYIRGSSGPGLAGTWREVGLKVAPSTFRLAVPSPGQVVITTLNSKSTFAGRTDGTPLTMMPNPPMEFLSATRP